MTEVKDILMADMLEERTKKSSFCMVAMKRHFLPLYCITVRKKYTKMINTA